MWPYYTGIRPFTDASFSYPAHTGTPVFAMTTCYQKRKIGSFPKTVTFIDGPFYPDESLPMAERKKVRPMSTLLTGRKRTAKAKTDFAVQNE